MTRIVEIHPELKPNGVLLADQIFCSFAFVALLMSHGVDVAFRIHHQLIVDFTPNRPHTTKMCPLIESVSCFIDALRWLRTAKEGDQLARLVVLPDRLFRYEPRVKKRRPKKYRLMQKPRVELKQGLVS